MEIRADGTIVVVNAASSTPYVGLEGISYYTVPQNDAVLPLGPQAPFVDEDTDEGFAPSTYMRTALTAVAADGSQPQSLRVSLQGVRASSALPLPKQEGCGSRPSRS